MGKQKTFLLIALTIPFFSVIAFLLSKKESIQPSESAQQTTAIKNKINADLESVQNNSTHKNRTQTETSIETSSSDFEVSTEESCNVFSDYEITLERIGTPWKERRLFRKQVKWSRLEPGSYRMEIGGRGWISINEILQIDSSEKLIKRSFKLQPLTQFSGSVLDAQSGVPIHEFKVMPEIRKINPEGYVTSEAHRQFQVRSAEGSFCVAGLDASANDVLFRVQASGYLDGNSGWIGLGNPFQDTLVIKLKKASESLATIEGTILSREESGGIANADIRAVSDETSNSGIMIVNGSLQIVSEQWNDENDFTRFHATSDINGNFRLEIPGPAKITLVAFGEKYRAFKSEPLTLQPGTKIEGLKIFLTKGAQVRGQIITEESKNRLKLQNAELIGPQSHQISDIDSDGRFQFGGLADGIYSVVINGLEPQSLSSGHAAPLVTETISIVESKDIDLQIPYALGLSGIDVIGTALFPLEEKLTNCRAFAVRGSEPSPFRARAIQTDGSFKLTDIPNGDYLLVVAGKNEANSRFALRAFSLKVAEQKSVNLGELSSTSPRISVLVMNGETPIANERVEISSSTSLPFFSLMMKELSTWAETDHEGIVVFYGLPQGKYEIKRANSNKPIKFAIPENFSGELNLKINN